MSPLGRRNEPPAERTEEERERARLEREARRAQREGKRPPTFAEGGGGVASDGRSEPEPEAEAGPPDATTPPPEPATPEPAAPEPPPPPATARDWREAAGTPDPEPPLVRRVERGAAAPAAALESHDEAIPEPAPQEPPPRRIPPAPPMPFDGDDQPLGTRRVSALSRLGPRRRPSSPPPPPPPPRPAPNGGGRGRRRVAVIALIVGLLAAVFVAWFAVSLFEPFKGEGSGTVLVKIPPGSTAEDVGDLLEQRGVVGSSLFFGLRARLAGKRGDIKAGTFKLRRDMSYGAALDVVTHNPPPPPVVRLTIPEGRSRSEIAPIAEQAGIKGDYRAASARSSALNPHSFGAPRRVRTLEGFLFPATYEFKPAAATARHLVDEQLGAFRDNLAKIDLAAAHRKHLTAYDVVTIASMIEREAAVPKDRPLIGAVIYNRLKQGMPLGIDATLRYALNNWSRPLRVSELNSDSPFNTRKHTGLPPTPIGNPGLASLRAAAHPAHVPYLFYVIKPCGKGAHAFSATDAQFQRDVDAYNRAREKQGGKSPVNC